MENLKLLHFKKKLLLEAKGEAGIYVGPKIKKHFFFKLLTVLNKQVEIV